MDAFFKIFPFFASDYFYIIMIALAYWCGRLPTKRMALELMFLVSISTIICILLKEFFAIARPEGSHMVKVYDPYGFPSADVAVAMIFWGLILVRNQILLWKIISPLMVLFIGVSRLYLGIHSMPDIMGGFVLGVVTILIWNSSNVQSVVEDCLAQNPKWFWLLTSAIVGLCIYLNIDVEIYPMIIPVYGCLIILGLFLFTDILVKFEQINKICAFILLIPIVAFAKFIPIYQETLLMIYISGVAKYAAITAAILIIVPKIHFCVSKKNVV